MPHKFKEWRLIVEKNKTSNVKVYSWLLQSLTVQEVRDNYRSFIIDNFIAGIPKNVILKQTKISLTMFFICVPELESSVFFTSPSFILTSYDFL